MPAGRLTGFGGASLQVLSSDWIEQGRPSPSSLVIPPAIVQRGQYEHLLNVPTLTKYAEIYSSPAPFRAACAPRILEAHAIWRRVFNATEPVDVSNPATIVGEAAAYAALRTGVQALAAQCAGENVLWAEAMNAPLEVYKVENEDVYLDLGNEAVVEQVLPHLLAMVARAATARCCNVCGRRPRTPGLPKLRMCAGCRGVRYCGAACQRVDWPLHQAACREPVD
jgi:hypothetical protein